uniref:DUF4042 domain-containing protein n=1 Tax=Romanomermis culicivorax TaxID=13658 RepID=A0A915L394_ROMCU
VRKLLSLRAVLRNSLDDSLICVYIKCLSIFLGKCSTRMAETLHVDSDLLGDDSLLDHFLKSIFDIVKSESLLCIKILLSRYSTSKGGDEEYILQWIFTVCLQFASWPNHKPKTEIIFLKIKKRNAPVVSMGDLNLYAWKPCTSSDENFGCASEQIGLSEFSDSKSDVDYEKIEYKTRTLQNRTRIRAASVFMRIPKIIDSNKLSKYWLTFFPDYCSRPWFTVCKILTQETCFNSRILLLRGMRNWVECNSRMLASAEIPRKAMPFTSLSEKLAQSLLNIHDSLELVVKLERYPSVIAQCIKCLESLARITPYEKIDDDRFFNIFSQCQKYVTDKSKSYPYSLGVILSFLPLSFRVVYERHAQPHSKHLCNGALRPGVSGEFLGPEVNLNVKIKALRLYAVLIPRNLSKNAENTDQRTFIISLTEICLFGADNRSIFPNDMCANPSNLRLACLLLLVEIVKHFRLYIR